VATPLIVNVIELLRRPGNSKDVNVAVAAADLDFNNPAFTDDAVTVELHLESLTNGISVHGTATAHWTGECRRCLDPVSGELVVDLDELYQQVPDSPDAYSISNDQINLLPMVRENLLVSVPVGPLCREDCEGYCQHCGTDLRIGSCSCTTDTRDPRWAALDALRGGSEEPSE
jgi:uncharacterized protein